MHQTLNYAIEVAGAHCLMEIGNSDLCVVGLPITVAEFAVVLVLKLGDFLLLLLDNIWQLNFELLREATVVGRHIYLILLRFTTVEI